MPPTYEYLCKTCDHEFERSQRITEDPIYVCPECKEENVVRLISASNFVLRGGGWFSDGYSGKTSKKEE